jgi:hypothetical protein
MKQIEKEFFTKLKEKQSVKSAKTTTTGIPRWVWYVLGIAFAVIFIASICYGMGALLGLVIYALFGVKLSIHIWAIAWFVIVGITGSVATSSGKN